MLLASIAVKAQVPLVENVSISVSARVVSESPVELTTLSNMIVVGGNNGGEEIYISPISSANAGLMQVKGTPGSQARITYIMSEVLSEASGQGSINIKYEMSGNPERVQSSSKLIDTGETILNFGADGLYFLWVGGHIDLSNTTGGKFVGQFTLEIDYI